ncbi:MAG TPA: endonuclease/exonuclease/phosphatase family protein [Anaeromyxobacteraceae bacterium]|nr:endonuclease/exonuclease/phosphatase family protein [Anaeromyxobacteraceae bacterium]
MSLRLMTWNVHGMHGRSRRHDPDRVAQVIIDARVDVAGLQEVGALRGREGLADPKTALEQLTGLSVAYATTELRRGFPFGNATLARHPITATRTYDLSVAGREPRGCLRTDIDVPGGALHFFNVHLGLAWRERRRQASQLLSADILRDAALLYPLVLVGDFNSPWPRISAVPRWIGRHLRDGAVLGRSAGPTFPSRLPFLRLDRAFVGPAVRVLGAEVLTSQTARLASDHLPIVLEIELEAQARRPPLARDVQAAGVATVR